MHKGGDDIEKKTKEKNREKKNKEEKQGRRQK
jgi:hypothetical protein